jgi:pyruvate dehydrogenase E1 component
MSAHQQKKLDGEALVWFRDRFELPLSDDDARNARFYRPAEDSPELRYLCACRKKLGGFVPRRSVNAPVVQTPSRFDFAHFAFELETREASTTVAFVRMLSSLLRNRSCGRYLVPIVADEARTFGMQSLFRQSGIYSHCGQLYQPEDQEDFLWYKEARSGQILQKASMRPGRSPPGSRLQHHTRTMAFPCCRSTSSIPCSDYSASAT